MSEVHRVSRPTFSRIRPKTSKLDRCLQWSFVTQAWRMVFADGRQLAGSPPMGGTVLLTVSCPLSSSMKQRTEIRVIWLAMGCSRMQMMGICKRQGQFSLENNIFHLSDICHQILAQSRLILSVCVRKLADQYLSTRERPLPGRNVGPSSFLCVYPEFFSLMAARTVPGGTPSNLVHPMLCKNRVPDSNTLGEYWIFLSPYIST